jgi:two-component sensor histidine kinase
MGQHLPHPDQDVTIEVRGDEISLPSRTATALALVVNELVQNGLKHAFVGREKGHIMITLREQPPGFEVEVQDDGVGLSTDEPPPDSLGLQIINTLVSQDLGGRLDVERSERGTRAIVSVPGPIHPQQEYSKEQM